MTKSQFNAANIHMQWVDLRCDGTEIVIGDSILQDACDQAGLGTRWRRPPVTMSRAFTRAVKALTLPEHHEVRQVNFGKKEIAFEVVSVRGGEGERENTYEHICSIVFDRITNRITIPYCGAHTADAVGWERDTKALFTKFASHVAGDIREMALKFLRTQGIMVMAGMYYVPPSTANNKDIAALKAVFFHLDAVYTKKEIIFPDLTNCAVWARKSMESELRQIARRADAIDTDKAREDTVPNMFKELNDLRAKYALISGGLGVVLDDVNDKITNVASKLRKRTLGEFDLPDAHKPVAVTEKAAPVIPITSARTEEPSTPSMDDIMSLIGGVDDEVGF